MYFYYGIVAFIIIFYFALKLKRNANTDNFFLFVVFVLLIAIAGIRSTHVGGDLNHYIPNFFDFGRKSFTEILQHRFKYGYIFSSLCKIEYWISSTSISFLLCMNALALIPVYYFIKKYSPNYLLSVYIYITFAFYTNTFNSVRSSISMGIGLIALKYVMERNFRKFIISFLIATEIHLTFAPFILLYLIYPKKVTIPYMVSTIGLCICASQALSLWGFISSAAIAYDEGAYGYDKLVQSSGGYAMLALITVTTFAFYFVNRKKEDDPLIHLSMHCLIIASCILAFATALSLFNRIAMFFYIILIIYVPITLKNIKTIPIRRCCSITAYILFFMYFIAFVMTPLKDWNYTNKQGTLPYEFYWERNGI